jgi:hypothetical protein
MNSIKQTISDSEKLKRINDTIAFGNEWYQKKIAEGWEETEFGLMSPKEINESGMTKNNGQIWAIPTLQYICDKREIGRNKGEKYVGIEAKFLAWYKKLTNKLTVDDYITNEINKEKKYATKIKKEDDDFGGREFSIDDIPF